MNTLNTSFKPDASEEPTQEEHDEYIENQIYQYQLGQVKNRIEELQKHIRDVDTNIKSLSEVRDDYKDELKRYRDKYPECFI